MMNRVRQLIVTFSAAPTSEVPTAWYNSLRVCSFTMRNERC